MLVQTEIVSTIPATTTIKAAHSVIAHFILVGKVLLAGNGLKTKVYGVVKTVNGYTMMIQ